MNQPHNARSRGAMSADLPFVYTAYGLNIQSSIQIPELLPGDMDAIDIIVKNGQVPDQLDNSPFKGHWFQVAETEILVTIKDVANYLIRDGNEITIDADPESDIQSVRVYLLTTAITAILHQRGILPLHGSSVVTDHGAVIFAGASKAGKSTTAAAFRRRGYQLLADDTSVIKVDDHNTSIVLPSLPQQKLWPDAIDKLGEVADNLELVRPQSEKYSIRLQEEFFSESLPLHAIYILTRTKQQDQVIITPIDNVMAKFALLQRHTFRRMFAIHFKKTSKYFDTLQHIVKEVPFKRVARPADANTLPELIDLLEDDLRL